MRWLADLSIRTKLTLITVLTSAIALLLAGAVIIAYDNYAYRTQKTGEISAQAGILAASVTASLEFNDPKAAQDYLNPLEANPEITAAGVYASNGSLFASYARSGTRPPPPSAEAQVQRFEGNAFFVFRPVQQGQRQVGTVYLRASTEPLGGRVIRFGGIILLVMIGSLFITLPIAMRLHSVIANPAYARSLIEASLDPLVTISPEGKITDVNEGSIKVTGVRRGELIGTDFSDYFTEPEKAREGYQQVFSRGSVTDYPLTIRHRDGKLTEVLYNASVYKDESGNVLGVLATARDVTDRKRFEHTLQEKNVELEGANLAKDHFLSNMSHELRTPLNAIIGFTGTLLMKLSGPLTADQAKQLSTVQSSTRYLLSLINDLLDLAKIESGKVEVNLEPVPCLALIEEVVASLKPLAEGKSFKFSLMRPAKDMVARTDRRMLSQIVINLANNAIKFTDKGSVTLRLGERTEGGARFAEISVLDTGIGIREEDQGRLFQAFEQMEAGRRDEGTGLGLHLSQKFAGLIGARIEFESTFGKGSRFTLLVPMA